MAADVKTTATVDATTDAAEAAVEILCLVAATAARLSGFCFCSPAVAAAALAAAAIVAVATTAVFGSSYCFSAAVVILEEAAAARLHEGKTEPAYGRFWFL